MRPWPLTSPAVPFLLLTHACMLPLTDASLAGALRCQCAICPHNPHNLHNPQNSYWKHIRVKKASSAPHHKNKTCGSWELGWGGG